jgi:hypothetical protein
MKSRLVQCTKEHEAKDAHIRELVQKTRPQYNFVAKTKEEARLILGLKKKIDEINKEMRRLREENEEMSRAIVPGQLQNSRIELNASMNKCKRMKNILENVQKDEEIFTGDMGPEYLSLTMMKLKLENQELQASYKENSEIFGQLKKKPAARQNAPGKDVSSESNKQNKNNIHEEIKQLRESMNHCNLIK